jgi:hypothetical protein
MMIVIKAAKELLEANIAEAWRYPTVWEPVVDRLAEAVKDLEPAPNMRLVSISLIDRIIDDGLSPDVLDKLLKISDGE